MLPTCRSSKLGHAPPDTSISLTRLPLRPPLSHPTAPSTSSAKSCARCYPVPPKQNVVRYSITAKKPVHCALPSKKWGIPYLQPQWQPTTTPQAALHRIQLNRSAPKPLTCVFIGSTITIARGNSQFLGAKDGPSVLTTFPSIMPMA